MSTVIARKPTKKAFFFPTSGDVKRAQRKAAAKAEAAKAAEIASQVKESKEAREPKVQADDVASTKAVKDVKDAKAPKAVKATRKAAKTAAKTAKAPRAPEAAVKSKGKQAKKEKVIRDSFTMPKADHERIAALKRKCLDAGISVKKSELLRAGIQLLDSASSKRLLAAISALETVKTGRPAKGE